ncbi:unnamed protein product, partial [Ectocarpus fasciculatus]
RRGTKVEVSRSSSCSVMNPPLQQAAELRSGHVVHHPGAGVGVGVVPIMRRPEETVQPRSAKTLAKEAGKGKGKQSAVECRPRRARLLSRPHLRLPSSSNAERLIRGQGLPPRVTRTLRKRTRYVGD